MKEYRKLNKLKFNARECGRRIKIPIGAKCNLCNNLAVERHHKDYSKPFEIVLLCKSCHQKITNNQRLK